MSGPVKAPFPYPGGKSRVADIVWRELGDPYSYLEPFCGSAAVLLARPASERPRREIIGDLNGFVANAWRAIQYAPEATARHAWWPSIHADLTARHQWLVDWARAGGLERLKADPFYYDAQVAGWWIWGISNYISIGDFCQGAFDGDTPGVPTSRQRLTDGGGVRQERVGDGVQEKIPSVGPTVYSGRGVQVDKAGGGLTAVRDGITSMPPGSHGWGSGVKLTKQSDGPPDWIPISGNSRGSVQTGRQDVPDFICTTLYSADGQGVQTNRRTSPLNDLLDSHLDEQDRWIPWLVQLSQRLAKVHVINRPWESICLSRSVSGDFEDRTIGVFLDPPYRTAQRAANLYAVDDGDAVSDAVWAWAKEAGDKPHWRIVMCALEGDYDTPPGWRTHIWRNAGSMGGGKGKGRGKKKPSEILLFSPHCLGGNAAATPKPTQGRFF